MPWSRTARATTSGSRTEPMTVGIPRTRRRSPVDRSSRTTTSSSASRMASTTWAPMYPAPPVTSHVMSRTLALPSRTRPLLLGEVTVTPKGHLTATTRVERALRTRLAGASPATRAHVHRVVVRVRAVQKATRTSVAAVRDAPSASFALARRDGQWCLVHRTDDGDWVSRYREGATIDKRPLVGPTVRQLNARARDYFLQEYVPREGDVVVDVGAGVGAEMHLFAALVGARGRLFAIEAHPRTYEQLARLCRVNRRRNVEPHLLAITDGPGEITITDTQKHIANTVIGEGGGGLRVPADTLDRFVEKHGIT